MKKFLILIVALVATTFVVNAGEYRAVSFLSGTNLTLYTGTSDLAQTFDRSDAWATNRLIIFPGQTTALAPYATNSSGTAVYPGFARAVELWPDRNGNMATNMAVQLLLTENGSFTNTIWLSLARSVDGINYDTSSTNAYWNFHFDPANGITVTNIPVTFLAGAHYLILQHIVTDVNPADGGTVTINKFQLGGWEP